MDVHTSTVYLVLQAQSRLKPLDRNKQPTVSVMG